MRMLMILSNLSNAYVIYFCRHICDVSKNVVRPGSWSWETSFLSLFSRSKSEHSLLCVSFLFVFYVCQSRFIWYENFHVFSQFCIHNFSDLVFLFVFLLLRAYLDSWITMQSVWIKRWNSGLWRLHVITELSRLLCGLPIRSVDYTLWEYSTA